MKEYEKYFDLFDPVDYNPREWVRLAKEAGMKYAVLTAKHHDGFCLFDSKLTDYTAVHTKAGRDLVREFVDACREEGLRVGFYFSIIDWHHPDFPKYGDRQHPMRNNESYKDEKIDFDRYLDYMHAQVKELVTNYGKLDLLWFDFSYDDMCGEKWRASELIRMVRKYQPDVIIDNRLEGSGEDLRQHCERKPASLQRRFCKSGADHSSGRCAGCKWRSGSMGAVRNDEQPLGIL